MAGVYLAHHIGFDHLVTIKALSKDLEATNPSANALYLRQASSPISPIRTSLLSMMSAHTMNLITLLALTNNNYLFSVPQHLDNCSCVILVTGILP
ncbi:hypothetical protein MNBD_GAMMA05-2253 [hydrothermal vent metagenome]|uniref:Uncharacterized protein n=1 Tax=hydrothermal vent metagenome TaxID=652676 RepID=A0A3B0WIP4_9ZZZZ